MVPRKNRPELQLGGRCWKNKGKYDKCDGEKGKKLCVCRPIVDIRSVMPPFFSRCAHNLFSDTGDVFSVHLGIYNTTLGASILEKIIMQAGRCLGASVFRLSSINRCVM